MTIEKVELHAMGFRAIVDLGDELLGSESLNEILRSLGASRDQFSDATAWFSLEFAEQLLGYLTQKTGNTHFVEAAAERMLSERYLGPLFPLYRAFGSPSLTYMRVIPLGQRTNKTGRFAVEWTGERSVRLTWTNYPWSREREAYMCRLRLRQFQLASTLFGRPEATVVQRTCALLGDEACVYDVSWDEAPSNLRSKIGLGAGLAAAGVWATAFNVAFEHAAVLCILGAIAGWGLGRSRELRHALDERSRDLAEHERALTQIAQANEQRYADLLEAKAEVDRKVEQRTKELQDATQRLSETLAEIQALDRAKTDFFNNVSHELRSPLTMILAPLEDLVAGRAPAGGERAALESMRRNAARLLRLINQLLDLAKIDAGQVEIAPAPTDLVALVRGTLTGFKAAAQKKGVVIELRSGMSPSVVVLDASWIESAITNLIANALQFTEAGGRVRVSVEDRGSDVSVTVSDDGPGIAPEDQEKVFARFAQGDRNKRVGGTGIGLALVREAARLHGGDVRLVSELGKGSSFTFTIPRRPDRQARASVSARPTAAVGLQHADADDLVELEEASDRPGPSPRAPLALVAEDNPEMRGFMADVLAAQYRVRTASDGSRALALAIELKPDVVVSDVAMPQMDGYALCRALRARAETRSTPVLLVTARTEVASVLEGFEAGANDYVLKPFHGRELLARAQVHVRLRRMVQELALRERHAMLGMLAASVAHQVRNPLTTLVSGLPAMRSRVQDKVDPKSRDLMDVMIDCALRIERLTLDLMDLSRVDREAGGEYRPCDGLRSGVRLLRARVPPGVTIEESIADSGVIHGRAGDMNHVFLNLLDNAARAVGEHGTIRVEGLVEGSLYVVRVGDSGAGVDPETARRIFEPFFTTRPAGEGTGLGLAIARQVVQQAGGDIEVRRSELGGAAFLVRLPNVSQKSVTVGHLSTI